MTSSRNPKDLRVLMISTDRNLLKSESAVAKRHVDYGSAVGAIDIVLFSLRAAHSTEPLKLTENVTVYPTASSGKWAYILDALKIGKRLVRENPPDIVSAQNPFETGIVGWLLARKRGVRFDVQLHTDPFTRYFVEGHSPMHQLRVLMAAFLIPRAYAVRVVSERIAKHVRTKWPKARVHVLPIYVDVSHIGAKQPAFDLHEMYPQFSTIVLALSRLEPEKNIKLGIDAVARLAPQHPGLGFVVVGKGSQKEVLEAYAKHLDVFNKVVFHGWVDDAASAFKTADIFLLMSDFEGYALTLVEAAAAGTPVVTTDVGLAGDILKDGESALVCPPRDTQCMTEKLRMLLDDPALKGSLIDGANTALRRRVFGTREDYTRAYVGIWSDETGSSILKT